MKKSYLLISIMIVVIIGLSGCWMKKTVETMSEQPNQSVNKPVPEQEPEVKNPVFPQTEERPVAVMIDNEGVARSRQSGMHKAYAVYEMVAEGGETRFMAFFKGVNPEVIGPVRSSRHYFLHYALEHDPIYVHFGWSPLAERGIATLNVNNINGIRGVDEEIFWRNPDKRGDWQNAFTSMERIKSMIERKKYRDKTNVSVFKYSTDQLELTDGKQAHNIKIPYSYYRTVNYQYDQPSRIYKRFQGEKPHTDAVSKVQYSAKNIIIAFVRNYLLNDGTKTGRQQMDTVGSGKGYYITNGKYTEITWKKSGKTAKTEFKDKNGSEITLNNGQTWIQIVPVGADVSIK